MDIVLADLQRVLSFVKKNEADFIKTATEQNKQNTKKALAQTRKELEKSEKRLSELDTMFRKAFEKNALDEITNEQFSFLTAGYDSEKTELAKRISELRTVIQTADERNSDVGKFVALVRKYTEISELNYEVLHEFIDRILIHELDRENYTREIEIFYTFVGKVDTGDEPVENVSYFRQVGADVRSIAVV